MAEPKFIHTCLNVGPYDFVCICVVHACVCICVCVPTFKSCRWNAVYCKCVCSDWRPAFWGLVGRMLYVYCECGPALVYNLPL